MEVNFKQDGKSELANNCLSALGAELSLDELWVVMADVSTTTLLDRYAYQLPPIKPPVVRQFEEDRRSAVWRSKTGSEKSEISKKMYARPEVEAYMKERDHVVASNWANARHLEEFVDIWLEWDEPEKAKLCWDMYQGYPRELEISKGNVIWTRRNKWLEGSAE